MKVNKIYAQLKDIQHKILICYGGAGSGKSYYIAQRIVSRIIRPDNKRNWLIIRKVGATLRDSTFALLCQVIYDNDLHTLFKINKSEFTITCYNGYKIIMKGLDNPEKIKSITVTHGTLTDIWIEEATELLEEDINQLLLRLRGGDASIKKQVILTFNPISQLHWIKSKYFDREDDDVFILKSTYLDNAFLNEDDIKEIEKFKITNPMYYEVYGLGNWGVIGNIVFSNWKVEKIDESIFDTFYNGIDFGFTNDPTCILHMAYKNGKIYIIDEFYRKEMSNSDIAKITKVMCKKQYVYCDSAEPKSIRELRVLGINALPVKKGKDSIHHGIEWIKQQQIIINPSCEWFIKEIQAYNYKKAKIDGHERYLSEPIDINNHAMDAMRYGLEQLTRMMKMTMPSIKASHLGL
jgi:phage terminase large subunit